MTKRIKLELTEDQAKALFYHLNSLYEFEIDKNQKMFIWRIMQKLAQAKS